MSHINAEYVYPRSIDECANENMPQQQQEAQRLEAQRYCITNDVQSNAIACASFSDSYEADDNDNVERSTIRKPLGQEHQIHTISSSDDGESDIEQNAEEIAYMSSEESGDFEGFDDYNTPNTNSSINDTSQENVNISSNYLKRHSHVDINEYSEGILDAINVEDDEEEIAICEDGKVIFSSKQHTTPLKSHSSRYGPYTPNKRKKHEDEKNVNANTSTDLKTPPDQIVEVNSDSTTNSLKQKRQQINSKLQLNFCQQNHKAINNPNKCSSESTSEFPVSSPSNPQQPRGKYPARPPLLKNTLPADSFERQLAMITACNPQMTLAEKIQSWECDEELSDVEDVNKFDEQFKRIEKQRKLEMKQRENCGHVKSNQIKNFDIFRQMILNSIKEQKNKKYIACGQGGGGGGGIPGNKCVDTSGSESSKSIIHVDDRPSTSAVAQQQLQQRRSKVQLCLESADVKKRAVKEAPKRNQNSTTPPQTSSSDNERECFQNSKKNTGQRKINTHNALICPSSSEEAISQDIPTHLLNNKCTHPVLKTQSNKPAARQKPQDPKAKLNEINTSKNALVLTDEEIDSVFRLHRLNRERDKYNGMLRNESNEQSNSIIKMRLDFTNESKPELLLEKKQELFKTPIVPQKYFANTLMTSEYQNQNESLPKKNEQNKTEYVKAKKDDAKDDVSTNKMEIKSGIDDMDIVYHQQHEFCNYLGLTGMSTATAMANAVAELARCNLARRSMRVFRQQQQERREKSAKEEHLLKALKLKRLKDMRKREKTSCDKDVLGTDENTSVNSDDGSHSAASESAIPIRKDSNISITKSTKSQKCLTTVKKSPEIKIVCHITAKESGGTGKEFPSKYTKEDTQPVREQLMRKVKQQKPEERSNTHAKESNYDNGVEYFKNNNKEKTDRIQELNLMEKEYITRRLISPNDTSSQKTTRSKSRLLKESKYDEPIAAKSVVRKIESIVDTASLTESVEDAKCTNTILKMENFNKSEILNTHSNNEELSIYNTGIHSTTPTPTIIQQKLQIALEESRKSKPSIFIVQSLECKKEKANNLTVRSLLPIKKDDSLKGLPSEIDQCQATINNLEKSPKAYNKKFNKKKVLRSHKSKKYPISKRRLRKRNIIVIKTLTQGLTKTKRELRSSPKTNVDHKHNSISKKTENFKEKIMLNKISDCSETKSFRTVHTETKDLEIYLNKHNNRTKTRLRAKASALIERSKRMNLRGSCSSVNNKIKLKPKPQKSTLNLHRTTRTQMLKSKPDNIPSKITKNRSILKTKDNFMKKQNIEKTHASSMSNLLEVENFVVSSTTNTYDERPANELLATQSPITIKSLENTIPYTIASSPIKTKDQATQCSVNNAMHYLNTPPITTQAMRNPLKSEHGDVLYIYHELDILIVIQEFLVSFWKCSKLINMLLTTDKLASCTHNNETPLLKQDMFENTCNNPLGYSATSSTLIESSDCGEWNLLGDLRRLNFDFEISVPYANRICLHNSTPIYLEMRAQQLPRNQRECNLLSMYINIYYYHDEDMIAKCNSIPLDSIQSDINSVKYTTLTDSRYFIITWPQENLLGKTRSGLCKYSLTPQLDTLASIREFKSMRHTIRYLECMNDDKLIGFGDTQVSIWDYRSGDVLMNFDLEIPMGRNLGAIYFSKQDIEQNNMLILHQFCDSKYNTPPELMTIACTVTHTQPSYRVLQEINLPVPAFKVIKSAIKTGDHIVVTGQNDDELWINLTSPRLITVIENIKNSTRFYSRERSQLIEVTDKTLNVISLTNHILQLALTSQLKC